MDFDPDCRACPRLAAFLHETRERFPAYHAAPVAPFGDAQARLLIVGLAPGLHGANRTGRPFTGDFAGVLLYSALHEFGFSDRPESTTRSDGLRLFDCRITNAVKCVPPANKPLPSEIRQCNRYLASELHSLRDGAVILALGRIAHDAVARALELPARQIPFSHGASHRIERGMKLYDSYHCSRYNTQTRRLTDAMFRSVIARVKADLTE